MAVPAPKIDNWVRMVIHISSSAGEMQFPIDFRSSVNLSSPVQVAQMLSDFWSANAGTVKSFLQTGYNVDYLSGETRYTGPVNYQANYNPTQPQAGVVTGEAVPTGTAVVISKKTGAVGRSFNGRMYAGGFAESSVNKDNITGSLLSGLTALGNVIAAFNTFTGYGGTLRWVVPSRKLLVLTNIAATVINAVVDSQRRRLTGRGF